MTERRWAYDDEGSLRRDINYAVILTAGGPGQSELQSGVGFDHKVRLAVGET